MNNIFFLKVAFFEKTLNIVHRFCVEDVNSKKIFSCKLQKQ